jgi:calcineurin-like phosphoesterase family protein
MKITHERLRELYLEDLKQPDIHHGRTSPKARHIEHWENMPLMKFNSPQPDCIDLNGDHKDVWVWSDIHWGHKNIIKYADGHRPYNNVEEMDAALIANYKAVVKPQDVVIFGGDIGFKSENAINEILDDLPGYKIHIIGNHDIHRDGKVYKLNMDEQWLCYVYDTGSFQLLFTHYPMNKVPKGCVNIHGHIHQNLAAAHNINICVEHTECAPRNLKSVIQQAQQYLESVK